MGDTPGVKNAKSKSTMTSVSHLAMNEDQITEILCTDHNLLGSFSGGKLNTKG